MRKSLYDFCIANRKEALLRQWDREKNAPLTPSNVSQGSHKKVFWRCENNHVWNAAVYARTKAVDARIVRDADTADGHGGQPEKGLVGVPAGARLEGCHLPANRRKKMRLPRLRGQNALRKALKLLPAIGGLHIDIFNFGGTQIEKEVLITPVVLLHGYFPFALCRPCD